MGQGGCCYWSTYHEAIDRRVGLWKYEAVEILGYGAVAKSKVVLGMLSHTVGSESTIRASTSTSSRSIIDRRAMEG